MTNLSIIDLPPDAFAADVQHAILRARSTLYAAVQPAHSVVYDRFALGFGNFVSDAARYVAIVKTLRGPRVFGVYSDPDVAAAAAASFEDQIR